MKVQGLGFGVSTYKPPPRPQPFPRGFVEARRGLWSLHMSHGLSPGLLHVEKNSVDLS